MFENFYRFRSKPFQLAPNPDFLYKSAKHENALTYMEYGLSENVGILVLTGEVGSGKTTTVQYVLNRLGEEVETALIANTNVSSGEMLRMVKNEFEIATEDNEKSTLIEALNRHLIDQYETGRRCLLVIDEAQNLSAQALEEVRMLSNLQSADYALLQIILIGQPELLSTLKKPEMRQFRQRVAVHFHLTALDREETAAYIAHRIKTVGGLEGLFTSAAIDMIYQRTGGIPRSINLICQAALVYGFSEEAERITQDIIHQIIRDRVGIGIESDPVVSEFAPPEDVKEPGLAGSAGPDEIENIRMEVKGRIQQLEGDMAAEITNLLEQVDNLSAEERRKREADQLKILELEKKIKVQSQLLEQLAKRLNNPSVAHYLKKTEPIAN